MAHLKCLSIISQNGEQPKGVHEPGNVDTVLLHITDTLHLVDMHNQVLLVQELFL